MHSIRQLTLQAADVGPGVIWAGPVGCGCSGVWSTMDSSAQGGLSQRDPLPLPHPSCHFLLFIFHPFLSLSISGHYFHLY